MCHELVNPSGFSKEIAGAWFQAQGLSPLPRTSYSPPPPPPPPTQCRPLNSDEYLLLQVQGRVSYNGQSFNSFQVPRTAAYVQQTDSHMAQLTVRETFDFAARVQGIGCQGGEDLAKVKPGRPYDSMMRWNVLVTCPVMAACS